MAFPPPPRSAAVQIVRPPPSEPPPLSSPVVTVSPARANAALPITSAKSVKGSESPGPASKKDAGQKLCRNVMIYGSCRFQDTGCVYYHPPPGESAAPLNAGNVKAPGTIKEFVPKAAVAAAASSIGLGAGAPEFVPKTPIGGDGQSPAMAPGVVQPQWGTSQLAGGLLGMDASASGMQPSISFDGGLGVDSSMGMDGSMYLPPQQLRQPLDYNLYTSPLPSVANPPLTSNPLHSFFIADDLRRVLTARNEAQWLPTGSAYPGLPAEVGVYHSPIPLDPPRRLVQGGQAQQNQGHPGSRVYMHPAPVYRARSLVDGGVYALRRIEGYKLVNEAAFGAIDVWRRMRHPNIVGLREAFTTKAFGDNSLVLIYDYHPDSTTILDEHLSPDALPASLNRRRGGMPIPERVLWTYVTQIANALKAIHSSGLAARNMDPCKILITGKNRIRLNGCGILDVLAYDASTPVTVFQQEDLVSFGKLVISLCCEFFQPGQHPGAPLEHISRNYSPDVKNLIMFLISKPQPGKGIDDVIRMLGARVLNELDAAQNYVDVLEDSLSAELENGRLVRLMTKLGFINERAEFELDPRWSDTGDRYILKLFRDYVFHSVGPDGRAVLDLSHVLTCLNKLDAGLDERIMLVSRDDQSCLVVTYREIKTCLETAFNELKNSSNPVMGGMMMMGR